MVNGYLETINKGMNSMRCFNKNISYGNGAIEEQIAELSQRLKKADAVVIGAGAGLSTSAGFTYAGERFRKYFFDFEEKYNFHDMYSGGFFVMNLDPEIAWAYWARNIYINRYMKAQRPVYEDLLNIVKDKDYFVITTNVDHQFQKAGFGKEKLFYTQGDYGLFQTIDGSNKKTYDNEEWVMKALSAQGFVKDENGIYQVPVDKKLSMSIPKELIPKCPDDGSSVTMNLRSDDNFVEDEGWHKASNAYYEFLKKYEGRNVLFLELGVGSNTPIIIKYPFWAMTMENDNAFYACINYKEAFCPLDIKDRSVCIDSDIGDAFVLLSHI